MSGLAGTTTGRSERKYHSARILKGRLHASGIAQNAHRQRLIGFLAWVPPSDGGGLVRYGR